MKKLLNTVLLFFSLMFSFPIGAQSKDVIQSLWEDYFQYKEESISNRRINHQDIKPLILELKNNSLFEVNKVGKSIEGRELLLISIGTGETDIFLWSQMHGDESTATMAIFDILNFLKDDSFNAEKEQLLNKVRLHFLPMLNPDGAEVFQRRNALGIDVNRDALRLQSPEGRTLKRVRDSLEADFGFNLHDQSKYYNAKGTANPASISFLAPAYNYEKDINETRGNAMKLIVEMNELLQQHIPGQVARYNDDFEPRAFGDNIQKWGTSTILIESGGFFNDPEKQEIRKLNYIAILSALFSISNEGYKTSDIITYEKIPENESKLFDLKLIGLQYELLGEIYILDFGINQYEVRGNGDKEFFYRSRIVDQGDLSTNYGYLTKDFSGYKVIPGKIYPKILNELREVENLNFLELLDKGYSYIRVKNLPEKINSIPYPIHIVKENFVVPEKLNPGSSPTFFLVKKSKPEYAVINGFLLDLENIDNAFKNGLILK